MIIDSEVHILPKDWVKMITSDEIYLKKALLDHSDYNLIKNIVDLDVLLDSMQKNNIEKSLIMGLPWIDNNKNILNNDFIFKLKSAYPDCFDVMIVYDISHSNDFINYMNDTDIDSIKGIKFIGSWQNINFIDDRLAPVFKYLTDKSLIFMPHIDHLTQINTTDTPQNLYKLLKKYPNLKVLAPHMAGGLFLYEGFDSVKPYLKNLRYLTSISSTMYMVKTGMQLCPEKIIFGTDFPFNHCHNQSNQIEYINTHFSSELKEKIFKDNYQNFV